MTIQKVIHIAQKDTLPDDYLYWKDKSPEERLNAIEFLRKQYYDYENQLSKGLQRVCRVIRKK